MQHLGASNIQYHHQRLHFDHFFPPATFLNTTTGEQLSCFFSRAATLI
jgi:hypothetical protein